MTKDMTQGNPLVLILKFSLPLLLGNLFQQTYNMVDAIIVGKVLGSSSLAAVGASSSVQFLVLGFCIGFCAGFAVPVAQRFGAGDYVGMRRYIFLGTCTSAGIALVLTTLCAIFTPQILLVLRTSSD
ncbi:MAG: oligosaccharide flippase family protein, partial [Treponema sp.]|nr:oligosaccharide flippase family protein [Treponema sp.]